ncbi:MAG: hypothetical protein HFI90_06720 [Clostridia bacterium]|nr:hypothetical protein [Clostridia bacterium]
MYDDILSGLPIEADTDHSQSNQQLFSVQEDIEKKLRKTKKKLKKAKKKGKDTKKFKKKYKKLQTKFERMNALLAETKKSSPKGRWDATIERTLPELVKLTTVILDRKLPPGKGGGKND